MRSLKIFVVGDAMLDNYWYGTTDTDWAKQENWTANFVPAESDDIEFIASKYLNDQVANEDEALQGARDIIAEWINENTFIRKNLRRLFQRKAIVSTKVVKSKKDDEAAQKFNQYFDWAEPLSKAPSHRLLAMLRAEAEGFVKMNIEIDPEGSGVDPVPKQSEVWEYIGVFVDWLSCKYHSEFIVTS